MAYSINQNYKNGRRSNTILGMMMMMMMMMMKDSYIHE